MVHQPSGASPISFRLAILPASPCSRGRYELAGYPCRKKNSMPIHRAISFATVAIFAVALAPSVPSTVAAQDDARGRGCSARTLRGDYGLIGTGTRGVGPGTIEPFVTIPWSPTTAGHVHSRRRLARQTTGVRGGPASGTYFVNADCTGGQTTHIPGIPPLEDKFVIVDNGREVRTVVVAPLTTIATANLRKK